MREKLTFEGHGVGPWTPSVDFFEAEHPFGEVVGPEGLEGQRPEVPLDKFLVDSRVPIVTKDIANQINDIRAKAVESELPGRLERTKETLGRIFAMTKGDKLIHYPDSLKAAREKTGKQEAAMVELADFNGQKAVLFTLDFKFMGGSKGEVEGELLIKAADYAREHNLPLVAIYATGGIRQQENVDALMQMPRCVAAIDEFQRNCKQPYIAIQYGETWGGVSAGVIPIADVNAAVAGGNAGFAGGRVIAIRDGKDLSPGDQAVERLYPDRWVDVILQPDEVYDYISEYLRIGGEIPKNEHISKEAQLNLAHSRPYGDFVRTLIIGQEGIAPALPKNHTNPAWYRESIPFPAPEADRAEYETEADRLYHDYVRIKGDAGQIDGKFAIDHVFDEAIYLFNSITRNGNVIYPAIISAIARIGMQQFFVFANQPSYALSPSGRMQKFSATPTPNDFRRYRELREIAERRELPVVTFINTQGADASLEAERNGQGHNIAFAMRAGTRMSQPGISINIGYFGSGGGMGLAIASRLYAVERTMLSVADATAAATIMHGKDPGTDRIKEFILMSNCTAEANHRRGNIRGVIPRGETLRETAFNIRQFITEEFQIQSSKSPRSLAKENRDLLRANSKGRIKHHGK